MRQYRIVFLVLSFLFSIALQAQTQVPVEQVDFYQNGSDKFEALLADMQKAKHHLHVEYFIFANDAIADRMLQVMRRKVREGVKVRLIIDSYYDVKREYNYRYRIGMMQADGIDVYLYDPYKFPYINHNMRDHRKIVIIDGKVGYTGGFNVADYNIKGKPGEYGGYVDTHVRLEGAVVEQLQALFNSHFEHVGGSPFGGENYFPYTYGLECDGNYEAAVIARGRHDGKRRELRKAIVRFINNAQHDITIQSPYILPTPGVRRALRKALRRGVKVSVMFSEKGDLETLDLGNISYARQLQRRGAEVWLYQDAFLHSKVLTADGNTCMVGSMNLDYRALRLNEEVGVIVYGEKPTRQLNESFEKAKSNCIPMDDEYLKKLRLTRRISGRMIDYFFSWGL